MKFCYYFDIPQYRYIGLALESTSLVRIHLGRAFSLHCDVYCDMYSVYCIVYIEFTFVIFSFMTLQKYRQKWKKQDFSRTPFSLSMCC